ncbi:ankyrin repeat-containing protein At5g02620-like [Humulus lupulus]|uniref:ankyrin repeat-containing protein At5g02620-like n=1 Tax=Humulus lupulus TaxID=3486 RepID=UPI002B414C0C|nr:ankyrin repeat-containing protein At5g02620-like [Humulus lupulus]
MDPTLFEAAKNGLSDSSRSTFEKVDPKAQVTIRKDTIMHVAVKHGNKESTQQILDLYPWLLHETNLSGDTPLHIAARLGHSDLVKLITSSLKNDQRGGSAEAGTFPLRALNEKKDTALHNAVKYGHSDVVNSLIKEDPGLVYISNDSGESPLFIAVDKGFHKIAVSILGSISDWSGSCGSGRDNMTVMHAAADYQVVVTKLLQKCNAEILEEKDKRGRTALHYAAYVGNSKVVELFLKHNRSIAYIKDDKGMSAMHIAAMKGHIHVINELVKHCPDVCELLDNNNQTPLHVAVRSGREDTVRNFLHRSDHFDGIMPNEQDNQGNTPLHVAALNGHLGILIMLAKDPRVEKRASNHKGKTVIEIIQSSTQLPIINKRFSIGCLAILGEEERLEKRFDSEITRTSLPNEDLKPQSPINLLDGTQSSDEEEHEKHRKEDGNNNSSNKSWDKNLVEVNLLVATIIASITFAAAVSMPGGYGNPDGMPILRKKLDFKIFLALDSVAFGLAAASMIIHFLFVSFSKLLGRTLSYPFWTIMLLTYFSIAFTVFAFVEAFQASLKQTSGSLPAICALLSFTIPFIIYAIPVFVQYNRHIIMYIKALLTRASRPQ